MYNTVKTISAISVYKVIHVMHVLHTCVYFMIFKILLRHFKINRVNNNNLYSFDREEKYNNTSFENHPKN